MTQRLREIVEAEWQAGKPWSSATDFAERVARRVLDRVQRVLCPDTNGPCGRDSCPATWVAKDFGLGDGDGDKACSRCGHMISPAMGYCACRGA